MLLNKTKLLFLPVLFFACTAIKAQQTIQVKGTVRNEKNEAIQGATIQVSGTLKAAQTNREGNFSIEAPEKGTVIISYVGYETIKAAAKGKLDITLKQSVTALSDVVVIGYGSQKRKELTGAISTVSAKDFQKGSITTPEQLIAGKVAGVSVTSNGGSPGAGSTIRIRGGASLSASNDPLIVIDGVPLSGNNIYGSSNSLSLINPNDIETFTVLRDASATAIYGSRASNGVILITTKKGATGKPAFTFTTQISVSKISKYADVMSGREFRKYVDSFGTSSFDSLVGNANTDWQKEIYQTALGTDNNLSIAGAFKNLPYRLSLGYYRQDGVLKTDNLQRITAGVSMSPRLLNNHLKIDINIKGAINNTRFANNAAISSAVYFDPTQPVKVPADPENYYGDYFEWAAIDPNSGSLTLNKLAPKNPVALLYLYKNISEVQRSYGNIQFDYKFHNLPDLRANLNLGYDIAKGSGTVQVPRYAAQNYLEKGQNNKYSNSINNTVGEFYLNYTKNLIAIKSNINLTGGTGYYKNLSINDNYYAFSYNGDTIPGSKPGFLNDKPKNVLISYYGRMIYTLNTKYILAASVRTDGSSKFSKDNRWGIFPSVAMTWRINEEKCLKNSAKLSDLKLRISYGVTGQQDGIPNYSYQAVYSSSGNSSLTQFGDSYYNMGTPEAYDKSIKWEQTEALNIGLDFGFLDNRISGSIDLYKRKTKDLLNDIPLPSGSNFSSHIVTNIGNVDNKGIEATLNFIAVKKKNLQWDINFNAAYNFNKITKLTATDNPDYPGTAVGNLVQINSLGYIPNSFYVFHQQYDVTGKPIEGVYRDVNNDGIVNEKDLYHYQSGTPKYILGFTTQVNFKQWSLNTVLRANIGNYMYNGVNTSAINSGIFNSLGFLQNSLKNISYSEFKDNQRLSDYYVENASFLRMDNIQLAYNAGKLYHDKVNLTLSANCQNVFTVTNYTGLDPEVFGGVDYILYPRPRLYVLGLTLQF